jgi:hypothetical protein
MEMEHRLAGWITILGKTEVAAICKNYGLIIFWLIHAVGTSSPSASIA